MNRAEQRQLEVSKHGEDYKPTSALNTTVDAFVKVVEGEEAVLVIMLPISSVLLISTMRTRLMKTTKM